MNYLSFISLALLLVAVSSCGQSTSSETTNNATATPATADGQQVYAQKCMICHGNDGKAGIGGASDLSTSLLDKNGSIQLITNGRKAMRPFRDELSAAEIEAVATYIQSLKK